MRFRPRLMFIMKWLGLAICTLIVTAFIISIWFTFGRVQGWATTGIENGMLVVSIPRTELRDVSLTWTEPSWIWARQRRQPTGNLVWPANIASQNALAHIYFLPLWLPLAAVLLPTLLFWFLDRRRPPTGHCPCGYNLTGNTTGRCPECGVAIQA